MRIIFSHAGGTMPFLEWRFMRESQGPNGKAANIPGWFIG